MMQKTLIKMAFKEDLKMFLWTVLLVYFVFPISTKANVQADRKFPINRNGDRFTNMVFNGTDTIYVAENGFVHTLDASLNPVKNFSTCVGDGCTNINKILSVFDDKLVLCGTGNNGICQVWNGNQFIYNSSTTIDDENYLVVSSDIDRPAVGLVHEEDLFLGVTFGAGIDTKDNKYKYLLSRREIKESFTPFRFVDLKTNIYENYLVYFKKVFEHEGFIYFLTNQKLTINSAGYVSKLVRICLNETIKNHIAKRSIKSYTDISMSCKVDGVDYNLLQDAEFLPRKGILVAAFAKGDDPENPQPGSAICVYTIDTVTAEILNAKENFITCNGTDSIDKESAYLDIDLPQCVSQSYYQNLKDGDYICPKEGRGSKVIGTNMLQPTTAFKMEDTNISIKTVKGVEQYSLYTDMFLGTDTGSIIKITILDDLTVFEYESLGIDNGHPILDIIEIENYTYVLTNRKVFRVKNTECSMYTTCKETMAAKNPSCGWCVGENRCTKRDVCSNTWLSSLSECVSIVASPKYVSVDSRGIVDINVKTTNLPSNFTNSSLKCLYFYGNEQIGQKNDVKGSNGIFRCKDPGVAEHKLYRLQLAYMLDTNVFALAETTIHVYKCTEYKKCGMCTVSAEVNCTWCVSTAECQNTGTGCSGQATVTKGNAIGCPNLLENTDIFIPNGISESIELETKNLVPGNTYKCVVENPPGEFTATVNAIGNSLKCTLNITFEDDSPKKEFPISVVQTWPSGAIYKLDEVQRSYVTVYNCGKLASCCTMCKALKNERYNCNWCSSTESCVHNSVTCSGNVNVLKCPAPKIAKIEPGSIGYKGGATITISGTNFGTDPKQIKDVSVQVQGATVGITVECKVTEIINQTDADFDTFIKSFSCRIGVKGRPVSDVSLVDKVGIVTFFYNKSRADSKTFTFKNPNITSITPSFGPMAGGTIITLHGNNLLIGNQLSSVKLGSSLCTNPANAETQILCTTPAVRKISNATVNLRYGDRYTFNNVVFFYRASPKINDDQLQARSSILSGGTSMTFMGINLQGAAVKKVTSIYANEKTEENCIASSPTNLTCKLPVAPRRLIEEMEQNGKRRKRSPSDVSITARLQIKLDGYEIDFDMKYFKDPYFDKITTPVLKTDNLKLTLKGSYLTLAATASDYTVTIGLDHTCEIIEVTAINLTCYLPDIPVEESSEQHIVGVSLGNFYQNVTFVKYELVSAATLQNVLLIVLPIAGGLLLLILIGGTVCTYKYRVVKNKAKKFEKNIQDIELKIKKVFREEFLDMHTTMSRVNESLIEKGFPYNSYQRYSFLMMFPGEWHMEEHPLMHEPVVSKRKVSDGTRSKLKKGMDTFEELMLNKFFLVSVISTMEKQKKFFLKEKSNMAGHLSVALLGRMEYFHEILTILLGNLVDETPSKSQKTLFRRCESITEKLLSNWLVLSLYPHVKMHSGSPLYMLLKGTQLTMESGPIDSLTGDSKYTLSEEKLLKQDDKPTTLTLKLMVDNCDEIRDCKVLDCDTISQVKSKCLSQIYVNYPASQFTVDSAELDLEWHWGNGGRLVIKDEDPSSEREGEWLRLNTLEHYNVKDQSSMALVDPKGLIDQEDYANLAHIRLDIDPGCNGSVTSNEPFAPQDEENGVPITRWHLVKQDSEQQKPGSVVIDELYLNRLITTKQSVLEYMRTVFDTILSTNVPPPAKFLFDFLDECGERNKVDPETVHAWKSQCYTIRFWATLINKPFNLFDQRIPNYVETSMQVISQVLIESCSLKAHQYTKDSSPGKLIFKNDMMTYRDKVKDYYNNVRSGEQSPEHFRDYLSDLNVFQRQQTSYNRHTALYTLYSQLQPYMDEIMEDLENNDEAKSLHLDRKLANLNGSMQED